MERRPEMDVPRAVSALPAPVSAAPALCLAAALVLGAGEARAAEVCSNTPGVGDTILCSVAASTPGTIEIDARNLAISTAATNDRGIEGQHRGREGVVDFDLTGGSVAATGDGGVGIHAWRSSNSGAISITTTNLDVTAGGAAGSGDVRSIWVQHWGAGGAVDLELTGGSLEATTLGFSAYGVWGYYSSGPGTVSITAKDRITVTATAGQYAYGLNGRHEGSGDVSITTENAAVTATGGTAAYGVLGWHTGASGAVDLDLTGGSVTAEGPSVYGVYGVGTPSGGISITTENLDVTVTGGQQAYGVYGYHYGTSGAVDLDLTGGSVTAEGLSGQGLIGRHSGLGSVTITTDAEAKIEAPFSVGVQGILTSGANEAGRVVIDSGGATEAREVGVFAWAARSSGHTFGEGAQTADDASRTEPMIHVTSSGDVTVGSSVTDAFIGSRVAGADGTLSTGEQGVLDAIVEDGGSDALDTALAALPAAYDDDYKAQARELLRKRGFETADGASLAYLAAAEILAIPRAGVRAMALSHLAIADHVRNGDLDPAILAIRVPWRTAEDRAALAEQGRLSDAERAVLEAVLTGGDVEAALDPLPADYTDEWRAGVHRHAMSYNAGDLRVDVTGGAIVSGGDGVDARHVLPHDRNGAIAVTVAEGAEVTGGRHGIFVGGAGFAEGNDDLRTQTVTVNGAVMGGTGAGVHLAGGGTVTVGRTGRIGATSGVGILSDGAGDLVATVAGTVEGDVRAQGGGALTVDVMEGGTVTGTVHDPAGPLTVAGSIGRLLYSNGGTVTVAGTGRLTGVEVEGGTEALRSEAGDLDVTVAGTVEGDLRAPTGGALTVDVQEGGEVTGTVHDPAGPLMVAGSIGRLLYTNGGTVTVAATGRLTGVEVEGGTEAVRSEAGDLAVTVAGTVAGDVRARGGGALTVDVQEDGAVTGTVHDPAGPLTVAGSIGRLLYTNGGTVTVAATGRLTGVEVEGGTEAVRSEAGDLSVTVAAMGRATGDLRAQGGGDLDATISGTVEGDVRAQGGGVLTLAVTEGGVVAGTVHDPAGPLTVHGSIGRLLYTNGGTVTVAAAGRLTGVEVEGGTEAVRSEAGDLALTVAGTVAGDVRALAGGALTLDVQEGGAVTGTVHDPAGPLTVAGSIGRLLYGNGGTVTVAGTGRLTGVEAGDGTEAVRSEAGNLAVTVAEMGMVTGDVLGRGGDLNAVVAGTVRGDLVEEGAGGLSATVTGTVEGNVFGRGAGEHTVTVAAGGTVTGTIDLAASTVTVGGTAGRVRFGNGGTVTVAGAGRLTGVEVEGGTEAVRSEAGDLAVAVSEMGTVTGGILGRGGDLNAVVAGTVGGDLVEEGAGGLSATISGTIEGNVFGRGAGEHTVTVADGGTVTGAIDLAAEGGTVTVGGTAGRVRLDGGGLVAVMDGGSIDSREDGIRAFYATPDADNGAISIVVAAGGAVTGAGAGIYVANAGLDAGGDGAADGVLKQSVTVHGTVTGGTDAAVHLVGGGTLEIGATGKVVPGAGQPALLVNDPGRSVVTILGTVEGGRGAAAAVDLTGGGSVTVGPTGSVNVNDDGADSAFRLSGGTYQVAIYAAGTTLTRQGVDEAIERVKGGIDPGPGGTVTTRPDDDGEVEEGKVSYAVVETVGDYTTGRYLPLELDDEGEPVTTGNELYAALPSDDGDEGQPLLPTDCNLSGDRCRLYEALPSVLLAMNGVPTYEERASAARDARGGWARVEAARGRWKADRSTQPDVAYDHRRYGVRAGMDVRWGGAGVVGLSVHGLRGSAEMAQAGEVELSGSGLGVHATRALRGGFHVDAQAAATWYDADLKSTDPDYLEKWPHGTLKKDVNGRGYALGVEVGKRLAVLDGGVGVTPRAGLRWSKVGLEDFTDEPGREVSVKDARSVQGRAGVGIEKVKDGSGADGSRLFGSVDVEREFEEETEARVAGSPPLAASARKTRFRAAAGAVHVWGEGRYALHGSVGYTAGGGSNRDFGGGLRFAMRF